MYGLADRIREKLGIIQQGEVEDRRPSAIKLFATPKQTLSLSPAPRVHSFMIDGQPNNTNPQYQRDDNDYRLQGSQSGDIQPAQNRTLQPPSYASYLQRYRRF